MRLEHLRILVSMRGPGTCPQWIPRDKWIGSWLRNDYLINKSFLPYSLISFVFMLLTYLLSISVCLEYLFHSYNLKFFNVCFLNTKELKLVFYHSMNKSFCLLIEWNYPFHVYFGFSYLSILLFICPSYFLFSSYHFISYPLPTFVGLRVFSRPLYLIFILLWHRRYICIYAHICIWNYVYLK